jgi:hypothetical protein
MYDYGPYFQALITAITVLINSAVWGYFGTVLFSFFSNDPADAATHARRRKVDAFLLFSINALAVDLIMQSKCDSLLCLLFLLLPPVWTLNFLSIITKTLAIYLNPVVWGVFGIVLLAITDKLRITLTKKNH